MEHVHMWERVLDIFFPPSKEALLVRTFSEEVLISLYAQRHIDGVSVLSTYKDVRIRALIHEAKFKNNTRAQKLLSVLVARFLEESAHTIDSIVPIPLSRARMRARGYNQVYEVLKNVTRSPSIEVNTHVLVRTRDTQPQTELKRSERLVNVQNAFEVPQKYASRITGKHVLIVDDVMTTGATLRVAKAALLPHSPASVTCVALAH